MYRNLFADLYDVFYSRKDYAAEADFIARELAAAGVGKNLLEFACGTGKHAAELARSGYTVHGFDLSPDQVRYAVENNLDFPQHVFDVGSMTDCGPGSPDYDAVLILFDSLGYVQTNDAVLETLRNARRHLRPGGILIVEVWHGAAFLQHYEPVREKIWETPEGPVIRTSRTEIDAARQLGVVHFDVIDQRNNGRQTYAETHSCRFFLAGELALFLETAGFHSLSIRPGFSPAGSAITGQDFHLVALART